MDFDDNGRPFFEERHKPFIIQELERIRDGFWFMNNGVATWITGLHYFYLNYWTLENGEPPEYRDADRRWFLFRDYCEKQSYIDGIIRTKKRREGATSQATADLVKSAITVQKSRNGIVSKTGADAKKAFLDMVVYGFQRLPVFLKPAIEDENSKTELVLQEPKTKKKSVERKRGNIFDPTNGIGSRVDWMNTVMNAYDSGRVTLLMVDEGGKFPADVPINEYWPIARQTLKQGGKRVGFALLPSTSNKLTKGGRGFKTLWDDSDHFKNKVTGSGLYRYFNDAADGLVPYIDEYGMSIMQKPTREQAKWMKEHYGADESQCSMSAGEFLEYQYNLIKDDAQRNEFKRMYPRTEKDAFDFEDNTNIYNVNNIANQKEYLLEANIKLRQVKFIRNHEGKADFIDSTDGMWWILKMPEEQEINATISVNGFIKPGNKAKYVLTCDPYKNEIISGKGSKAAGLVWSKFNPLDPENTGMPIAMFYGRPKLKRLLHEQMLLACEYYGCEACYESDYDEYITYFKDAGKQAYMMVKPKNTIDPNRKHKSTVKTFGIKSADSFSLGLMIDKSVEYVDLYCNKIYFSLLLDDLEEYDNDSRTDYDLAVAFQLGCVAISTQVTQKAADVPLRTKPLLQTYKIQFS